MKRKQVYITDEQEKNLKTIKKNVGIPESSQIRAALDEYFEKKVVKRYLEK